jgi:hypothetical protein
VLPLNGFFTPVGFLWMVIINKSYPYHLLIALPGISFAVLSIFLIHQVKIGVHHVGVHIEDHPILK